MAWELSASPTCLRNGPASTRCSDFLRASSPFELSLRRRRSPLPGNGISRAEKKAPIRRPNHRSAVSETKRSFKNPDDSGPFARLQEISANVRLRGGPGRTRTSNQTVMSAVILSEISIKSDVFHCANQQIFTIGCGQSLAKRWLAHPFPLLRTNAISSGC